MNPSPSNEKQPARSIPDDYCEKCGEGIFIDAPHLNCVEDSLIALKIRSRAGVSSNAAGVQDAVEKRAWAVASQHYGQFHEPDQSLARRILASDIIAAFSGSTVAVPAAVPELQVTIDVPQSEEGGELRLLREFFDVWRKDAASSVKARYAGKLEELANKLSALSSHGGQPESADGSGDKLIFNVREFLFRVNAFPFDGEGIAWAGLKTKAGELAGLLREKFGGSGIKEA